MRPKLTFGIYTKDRKTTRPSHVGSRPRAASHMDPSPKRPHMLQNLNENADNAQPTMIMIDMTHSIPFQSKRQMQL